MNDDPVQNGEPGTPNNEGPKGWYTRDGRLRGTEQPTAGKCGAKLRGTEPPRYCADNPMKNGKCRRHGGKSLKGAAAPAFETGDWSKYMPEDLREGFDNAKHDPELLDLKRGIALLQSLMTSRLKQMKEMDFPPWAEAVVLFRNMLNTGDQKYVNDLGQLLEEGLSATQHYEAAKIDVRNVLQELGKLAQAQHKMEMDKRLYIHHTEIATMLASMLEGIKRKLSIEEERVALLQYFHETAWKGLALPKPEPEVIDAEIVE